MAQYERIFHFDFKKDNKKSEESYIYTIFLISAFVVMTLGCIGFSISSLKASHNHTTQIEDYSHNPQLGILKNHLEENLAEHGQFLYVKNSPDNHLQIIATQDPETKAYGCNIKVGDLNSIEYHSEAYHSDLNKACNIAAFNFNGFLYEGEHKYMQEQSKKAKQLKDIIY